METTLSDNERRDGQRAALQSNLFGMAVSFVILGPIMMLYANDVLEFLPVRIAGVLALTPWLAFLRFPLLKPIRRFGKVHTLQLSAVVRLVAAIGLLVLPAAVLTEHYIVFLLLLLVAAASNEIGHSSVWQPLMRFITTTADRGGFFATMRLAFMTVGTIALALITWYVGETITERQYKVVMIFVCLGIVHHLYWLGKIPEQKTYEAVPARAHVGVRQTLRTSPMLRGPLVVSLLVTATTIPVMVLYLRQVLNVPSNITTMFVFMRTLGAAVSMFLWGRVANSVGFRPMFVGLMGIRVVAAPMILFVAPLAAASVTWQTLGGADLQSIALLLAIGFGSGVIGAGIGIAMITLQHFNVDNRDSLEAMNIFYLAIGITWSVITFASGWLLEHVAIPAGSQPMLDGLLHIDWIKAYLVGGVALIHVVAILVVLRLPNSNPDATVKDFFKAVLGK
jgi:MFS family permease